MRLERGRIVWSTGEGSETLGMAVTGVLLQSWTWNWRIGSGVTERKGEGIEVDYMISGFSFLDSVFHNLPSETRWKYQLAKGLEIWVSHSKLLMPIWAVKVDIASKSMEGNHEISAAYELGCFIFEA